MTEGSDKELEMQSSDHTGSPMTLAQKEAARVMGGPVWTEDCISSSSSEPSVIGEETESLLLDSADSQKLS